MARTYRFFAKNIAAETFAGSEGGPGRPALAAAERPALAAGRIFNLTENLEPDIFYQLTKVLRVKAGDRVVMLPAMQQKPFMEFEYVVQDVQKKNVALVFEREKLNDNELDFELGLILCLPNKPDKLEFILQKAVELGVSSVTLVEGDFSQYKHGLREDRLEKIMMEAAEQSERAVMPRLVVGGKLQDFLKKTSTSRGGATGASRSNIWVAMERKTDSEQSPKSARADQGALHPLQNRSEPRDVQILIGPEGGFSEEEKKLMSELGLPTFSLGKRILRMETAAILSLGLAAQ